MALEVVRVVEKVLDVLSTVEAVEAVGTVPVAVREVMSGNGLVLALAAMEAIDLLA